MTVGELLDALSRYDRDRDVITSSGGVSSLSTAGIGSVEPSGYVVIFTGDWCNWAANAEHDRETA